MVYEVGAPRDQSTPFMVQLVSSFVTMISSSFAYFKEKRLLWSSDFTGIDNFDVLYRERTSVQPLSFKPQA